MNEFKAWVAIVTLLIVCIMGLSFAIVHVQKQLNKAEALVQRLEDKEKKREKPRIEPKPSGDDGGL